MDEDFELCKNRSTFPASAVIKCQKFSYFDFNGPDHIGYNITVMATPCDGIEECLGGSDEVGCGDNAETMMLSIGFTVLVSMLVSGKDM